MTVFCWMNRLRMLERAGEWLKEKEFMSRLGVLPMVFSLPAESRKRSRSSVAAWLIRWWI